MEHGELVSDEGMKESAALVIDSSFQSFDGIWVNLVEATRTLPVLGLKLSQTPSFLEKVDQLFNGEEQANNSSMADGKPKENALQHANKMKAENFLISLLRIGSWQRVSRNDGDLVGKCYFAKRKLVWEFLENGLKSKIEIQWSDILSLKAVSLEGQSGILELELSEPPSFYHEIDPQPRKHTQWRMASDFTGGQAPTYRRHYLEFPPGALDRPLEKLLCYEHRLRMLSEQRFPTLDSPYFSKHTSRGFSLDFGGQLLPTTPHQHQHQQQQQLSFANVPTHYQAYHPSPLSSPISEYNYMASQQDQLGGLVPMLQQSMFRPSNDHQRRSMLLSNSGTVFSNTMTGADLFMQGHPRNNTNDNAVLMNNAVGGGQMYPQAMNWSPDNNSFTSSVITDDMCPEINNWAHDLNFRQWQ
ncbi:hypothetical protein V6N13_014392 [Hibiscus sabdariffa]|uniref:TRF2/HOY1 PH-like domain-containing protein n=1 Tax=Hibiscus sabdariffa TaxID=183260 RepID=A0ABR2RW01_9ROSI